MVGPKLVAGVVSPLPRRSGFATNLAVLWAAESSSMVSKGSAACW
jgi:hypothetical protein